MQLRRRLRALAISYLWLFLAAGVVNAWGRPDTPEPPAPHKIQWGGRYELSTLVDYALEDGQLTVRFTPPEEWAKAEAVRIDVAGSSAQWIWHYKPAKSMSNGTILSERLIQLWYRDAGSEEDEGHVKASVQCKGNRLSITGTIHRGSQTISVCYRSRPEPDGVELEMYLLESGEMTEQVLDADGASLEAIRAAHQLEVDELLAPILQKLAQKSLLGLGAGDVYRLFENIQPEPAVVHQLQTLLPRLDSPSVKERQEANDALRKLGRAGVLAAMRQDHTVLSPEQRARLNRFVASHQQRVFFNLQSARKDLDLLMECLKDEDAAVRAEAKRTIESLLGHAVAFDPTQGFEQRQEALRELQEHMEPSAEQPSAMYSPRADGF